MIVPSARAAARRGALLLALACAACVPAIPRPPAMVAAPRSGAGAWAVEPGDVVRLRVWDANSGIAASELVVSDAGEVLIPNAGRLQVVGSSVSEVEQRAIKAYQGRLDASRVEVTFLRPVAVLGGVRTPGVQLAEPTATVLSMIARASGPLRAGGDIHAYLLRAGQPTREVSTADRLADIGIRAADQLYVQDPVFPVRNEIAIRSIFEALQIVTATITLILLVRR